MCKDVKSRKQGSMSRSCSAPAASVSNDSWICSKRGHRSGNMPANALHSMAARGTAHTKSDRFVGSDDHFLIFASMALVCGATKKKRCRNNKQRDPGLDSTEPVSHFINPLLMFGEKKNNRTPLP